MDGVRETDTGGRVAYPRVLIVGTSFDLVTGGGITLTNLFHGWPQDRLSVASSYPCEVDPPPCARQYLLGCDELRWFWPLGRFVPGTRRRSTPDAELSVPAVSKVATPASPRSGRPALRVAKQAVRGGMGWLGGTGMFKSLSCSPGLASWVHDVRPGLIYTQLASLGLTRLVTELADRFSLPVAVHIMDDWPSTIYDRGLLGPRLRAATDRSFRALVTNAAATLAISRPMAEEYRRRYGRDWEVFHNPVDIDRWSRMRRGDRSWEGTFRIVYAGRAGLGIESSIQDVCLAVHRLRQRGHAVRLDIYTHSAAVAKELGLGSFAGVEVHPAVDDERMPGTLAGADLLVLPYDFAGRAARFACLSYPTKAPAYMATGVPTLVYAPREHALARDARAKGWAYVVDESGVDGVARAVELMMVDRSLRDRLAETAIATCESHHDARLVRERFRESLARAAGGSASA
jgi:glycosyltransferase involved in cell wall biosynthesis